MSISPAMAPARKPVRKRKEWLLVVGLAVCAALLPVLSGCGASTPCGNANLRPPCFDQTGHWVGATRSASTTTTPSTPASPAAVAEYSAPSTTTVTEAVTETRTVTVTTEPPRPSGFSDGTYKVGTDIPPGTYTTKGPADDGGHCYWERMSDDAGEHVIANDLTEGPTRFTVKTGEYLKIAGCTFTKA